MSAARVWLAFGLLSLVWGASYLFIRLGLRELSPLGLVALRVLVGAGFLVVIALVRRQDVRITRPQLVKLVILGSVNTAIPFLLISWGETSVSSGLASVLNSTVPIFGVLMAGALLHDEPITVARSAGVVLGFAGVVLLLSRDLANGGAHWTGLAAQAAIILASVCYAAGAVYTRRVLRRLPAMTMALYTVAIAAVETGILSILFSRPDFGRFTGLTVLAVLWLGVLGSGLAYLLAFSILSAWGASRYTLVTYLLPVIGLTLGALFLHEGVDWRILLGSALVILGVVLAGIVRAPGPSLHPPVRAGASVRE